MLKSKTIKISAVLLLALAVITVWLERSQVEYLLFGSHTTITKLADSSDGSFQGYLSEAQSLAGQNQTSSTTASFLAVGDIMLSRNVGAAIQKAGNADFPFINMSDVLKSTSFNFTNLESPVAPGKPVIGGSSLIFGAASTSIVGLKDFNFQVINLANNHAFDQGIEGIDYTRSLLNEYNIVHEGTGDNLDEAWTPAEVTANGIKICFVGASFSSVNDGGKTTNNYVARIEDVSRLKFEIGNLKLSCDFIVATMHAGIEYKQLPNQAQINFAHAAIDDGADMVIGAHPHWVQPIEKYNGKYIFYSLGNFVFDQNWSQDTKEGLTLKITLSKSLTTNPLAPGAANSDDLQGTRQAAQLDSIELIPVIIENSQPRPATPAETKTILNKIGETATILYP